MASPIPLSSTPQQVSTQQTRSGRAELLKDSVICRVSSLAEAQAAQDAGVGAIIVSGSTTDFAPSATLISSLTKSSPLPLVGQCRPGHFAEAQLLQSAGCDFIDEAEELDTVDVRHHIHKHTLKPVCISGAADLGGALRRISEGAAMVRTYGSDLANTVQSLRAIMSGVRRAHNLDDSELHAFAQELQAPFHILKEVARTKRLPVPLFASGGIRSVADVSLVIQLGANGVFLQSTMGSDLNRETIYLKALVQAVSNSQDGKKLVELTNSIQNS